MIFGPQRGSALTIFDRFASTFGMPVVVVVLALLFNNMAALLENGIVLIIVLFSPVYRLISYFFTYYSIDEEKFHVKSGMFNRKNLEIPLDSITTVDFTQNLIFQWIGVYSIKVDNASNYGGNGVGKIQLALKKEDAERFKKLLLSKKKGDPVQSEKEKSVERKVPVKNIFIMGALQSKGNAVAELFAIAAALMGMGNIIAGHDIGVEDKIAEFIFSLSGVWIAVILIIIFFILSALLGAIFAFIKYYEFRITESEDTVYLEYGLFTRKNHSLLKEKVTGIEYVQSFPMKFLKIGYLNVLAVGYSDMDSPEKALMYPLIREEDVYDFISSYIPNISKPEGKFERPRRSSIRYFFLCSRFIFIAFISLTAVLAEGLYGVSERAPMDISWGWVLLAMIVLGTILSIVAEYRNTAICAGDSNVYFVTGGFTRINTVVNTDMIESVSSSGSVLKRRKGIVTVKMGILAPQFDTVKTVRNITVEAFDSVRNVIHY